MTTSVWFISRYIMIRCMWHWTLPDFTFSLLLPSSFSSWVVNQGPWTHCNKGYKYDRWCRVQTQIPTNTNKTKNRVPVTGGADGVELAEYWKADRADITNIYQLPMAETSSPDIRESVKKYWNKCLGTCNQLWQGVVHQASSLQSALAGKARSGTVAAPPVVTPAQLQPVTQSRAL